MAYKFGSLVFTPLIKALQQSRRHYARMESGGAARDRLGPEETGFIADRDPFYMATVGADISIGDLTTGNRVAFIMVDYPQQARLKIRGCAEILTGEPARLSRK